MWLLREKLSEFRVKHLTSSWLIYAHPKNSSHLRSHSRAITALDYSRLGLENKSGRIFCVRQVYFTKSCQQIWRCVNQPFVLFIHHIWDETVLWGAIFIIKTSDRMQCFTIFQDKLHSVNIQDDQSWAFSETVQKISKITYTACRFSLLTSGRVCEWTLIELRFNIIKNLLCLFFLFNGFITMSDYNDV